MRVGAKVDIFNYRMRERRAELGITQKALSELSGVRMEQIVAIEKLRDVPGRIGTIQEKLHQIAVVLETELFELFPQDYLDMLVEKKLPRRRAPFIWCREISLEQLSNVESGLLLPSAEELVFDDSETNGLKEEIRNTLNDLPEHERAVLEMRFALHGGHECTYSEIGQSLNVSLERIQQIEAQALRRLRNPNRNMRIRAFLT